MRGFEREGGAAVALLDDEERTVIARIVADVGLLLGAEAFGMEHPHEPSTPGADALEHLTWFEESLAEPDDPALLKLLPSASRDDREVADEFRRLTEGDLRETKISRLRGVWQDLSEDAETWTVDLEGALDVAAALTDVRLVLATRLGLESDEDAERLHEDIARAVEGDSAEFHPDPERIWLGMLYDALTWLQDSLVTSMAEAP